MDFNQFARVMNAARDLPEFSGDPQHTNQVNLAKAIAVTRYGIGQQLPAPGGDIPAWRWILVEAACLPTLSGVLDDG